MAFINRHPVLCYYLITFFISWGAFLIVIGGPDSIPGHPSDTARLLPMAVLALVSGPFMAGISLTLVLRGSARLRVLMSSALSWRVGLRWYVIALLTTPIIAGALLFLLSRFDSVYRPGLVVADDQSALWLSALLAGFVAGLFEETGWTGFAIPELRKRHGLFATGLIVGFLWGVWHYIAAFWGSGDDDGAFSFRLLAPQMVFYIAVLIAFRVLMVWVYDRTRSLLIAMLMHASLTANTIFLLMPSATGYELAWYHLVLGAAFWALVGMLWRQQRGTRKVESLAAQIGQGS